MIRSVKAVTVTAAVHEGGCEPGLDRTVRGRAECDFLTSCRE